MKFLRWVSR